MEGVLIQEGGIHQELRIIPVALHLLLQDGIQVQGIVQGVQSLERLVVEK